MFGTFVSAMDATGTPLDEPTHVYGFYVPLVTVSPGHPTAFPSVLLLGSLGGFQLPGSPVQRIDRAIELDCEGIWSPFKQWRQRHHHRQRRGAHRVAPPTVLSAGRPRPLRAAASPLAYARGPSSGRLARAGEP